MAKLNTARIAGRGVEIKAAVVAGAAANTLLAIASMKADAKLIEVTEHATAALPADRLSVATAQAGGIKVNDDTTGNVVRVLWTQKA